MEKKKPFGKKKKKVDPKKYPYELLDAARYGDVERVNLCLQNGYDVNLQDPRKDLNWMDASNTSLHWATSCGHHKICEILLRNGATVNAANKSSMTSLHWAVVGGHLGICEILLKNGADVDAADVISMTSLHFAAELGHLGICEILLKNGADVDAADRRSLTSLHWAAQKGHLGICELLLKNRADVDTADKDGSTPLDFARTSDVKRLLKVYQKRKEYSVLMKETTVKLDVHKLLMCGYEGVGKTSLKQSLQKLKPKGKYVPTPGIDVQTVLIERAGKFTVMDLAGQAEYHASHTMFLAAQSSIFVVAYKITEEKDGKVIKPLQLKGRNKQQVFTWLVFIKATNPFVKTTSEGTGTSQIGNVKPTVILVASQADLLPATYKAEALHVMKAIREEAHDTFKDYMNIVESTYLLDCRDGMNEDIQKLRVCLGELKREEMIPTMCGRILKKKNSWIKNELYPVISWDEYVHEVTDQDEDIASSLDETLLATVTNYIHDMGEIINIRCMKSGGKGVIVLNPQWLCNRVFGPMLATEIFHQYSTRLVEKEIYSKQDLEDVLGKEADINQLIGLLEEFEFLFPTQTMPSTDRRQTFIIPGLLQDTMPDDQWQPSQLKQRYYGRRFQCHDVTDCFTAGFFPRLQTRFLNQLTARGKKPSSCWRNGLKYCDVVEGLVYMFSDRRAVHVCVRAERGDDIGKCQQLLQVLSKGVYAMLEITCPGINVDEFILSSESLRNHSQPEKMRYYSMDEIIEAEDNGQPVYDAQIGDEDIVTLLCQGYDKTFLQRYGYGCDVKWMLQPQKQKFMNYLSIKHPQGKDYRSVAELMGIKYTDVMVFENKASEKRPVTEHILEEWSKRWAAERPTETMARDFSNLKLRGAAPESTMDRRMKYSHDATRMEIYKESNFENLLIILQKLKRHDLMEIVKKMFSTIGVASGRIP